MFGIRIVILHKMKCKTTEAERRKLPDVGIKNIKKRSTYLNEDHKGYKLPHNGMHRAINTRSNEWELTGGEMIPCQKQKGNN